MDWNHGTRDWFEVVVGGRRLRSWQAAMEATGLGLLRSDGWLGERSDSSAEGESGLRRRPGGHAVAWSGAEAEVACSCGGSFLLWWWGAWKQLG